jgi:hypothetical protein
MTTSLIHHRPAPFIAAAAAVVAVVAGSVALAVADHPDQPSAPGQSSQTSVDHGGARAHHFHPTTSGGRVMIGQ